MKKLSIIYSLVMVFAVGTAQAQQYEVAPADTKAFMTETYLAPGEQVCFDIYLTEVTAPQRAGGAWIDFTDSTDVLSYVSAAPALLDGSQEVYGPWDPVWIPFPPEPPIIMIVVANLAGAYPDGDGDLIVGRVCLQCDGPGDAFVNITTIPVVATWTPADDTTINANTTQPVLTIHQVCDCTTDTDCDDGNFCNGVEVCDPICQCNPGVPPCDDGDECSLDLCDEDIDDCLGKECAANTLPCSAVIACLAEPICMTEGCIYHCDADCDIVFDASDNCPNTRNAFFWGTCTIGKIGQSCDDDSQCDTGMGTGDGFCSMNQEDTYPPGGNGIGDACECEGDFNCDGNVDATDVTSFLDHFGRSPFNNPCSNGSPCNGDFSCDWDVDAVDINIFLEDFGRSQYNNPCPTCVAGDWCVYP